MMRPMILAAAALLALSACGTVRELKPVANNQLPSPPYGRNDRPTAAELLQPTSQAMPIRSDELRTQSEERKDDPFDLPPERK